MKVVSILEETFDIMSAVDNATNQESGVNQGRLESLPIGKQTRSSFPFSFTLPLCLLPVQSLSVCSTQGGGVLVAAF